MPENKSYWGMRLKNNENNLIQMQRIFLRVDKRTYSEIFSTYWEAWQVEIVIHLCPWFLIKKAIWYVLNSWIFEYYVIFVQNWDSQQGRDSCLKINNYYVIFENSTIRHLPNSFSYEKPGTLYSKNGSKQQKKVTTL